MPMGIACGGYAIQEILEPEGGGGSSGEGDGLWRLARARRAEEDCWNLEDRGGGLEESPVAIARGLPLGGVGGVLGRLEPVRNRGDPSVEEESGRGRGRGRKSLPLDFRDQSVTIGQESKEKWKRVEGSPAFSSRQTKESTCHHGARTPAPNRSPMPRAVLLPRCPLPHLGTRHSPLISVSSSSSSPRLILARPGRLALCRAASLSAASWKGHAVDDGPSSVELEPVVGEEGFDRVVEEAQRVGEVVVVLWMANWCRKCIYLKPKLEKLAATYYPRIRFYSVDVNSVPQRLVSRAGIIKMPTIQIWKDCNKQGEVIGGHKAWLVVSEVQQLLENQE